MKKPFATFLGGLAAMVCLMGLMAQAGVEFYVNPAGNDANPGSLAAPFATLEQAQTAIRTLKSAAGLPAGGITVWLRGGIYGRTNTFTLTSADSGTAASPMVWRGYPGETARIMGATALDPAWFTLVTSNSTVWSRLDTNARGQVMQADLAAHGLTNYGTLRVRGFGASAVGALELFFTNAPMPLARWPDPAQDDPDQTCTNTQLTVYGNPGPVDVTGSFVTNGTSDGVNRYCRAGLVNGKQYYLYRYTWQYLGNGYTAWFLTTATGGYPGNTDPWWYRYATDLGNLSAASQSAATGTVTFLTPGQIKHGWAWINAAITNHSFTYSGTRPERWAQAEEPWFHGYWYYLWADQYQKAAGIDTNAKTILLSGVPTYGIQGGQPYYALNLLEEITRPGEWYLNRATGQLYFWPPAPLNGAEIYVSMIEQPLWRLNGTTNLVVRDLTLEMGRTDLVSIQGGAFNAFIHCTLRNAGNYAARVSGVSNGLSSCVIEHPGDGGVSLSGASSRAALVPVGNFVRNCAITDFSRIAWTYEPAVQISAEAVGCWVSHNVMSGSPHTALLFGRCNNNVIELNEIANVCQWTSDAGAVYIGRDWAARGNVIRWNFIHDVSSLFGPATQGIYLDDCQSGVQVYGNVLYRIADLGIQMGGGRDNIMENNVMARCGSGIGADTRGTGWMLANGGSSNLWANLQTYPYQSALWSNAYPACAAIPNHWPAVTNGLWLHPQGCVFSRNLGFANQQWTNTGDAAFTWFAEISNNLPNTDPLFVDETHLNLALPTNSPAYTIPGFQPIPFAQIGLEPSKTLTLQVQGQGAITATPSDTNYYPMQLACLTAIASNLWHFDSWSGAVSGTANPACLWMTNNLTVTAVFKQDLTTNGIPLWWQLAAGTNGFHLTFPSLSNRTYEVDYRTNLQDTNGWQPLTNVMPTTNVLLQVADPVRSSQRFYRIKVF